MRIATLEINNFRSIRCAKLAFANQLAIVGDNNCGKTTILEALNLVLGPDRTTGPDTIDEHDFYRGEYLPREQTPDTTPGPSPEIRIEVAFRDLSADELARFRHHVEPVDPATGTFYSPNELAPGRPEGATLGLRLHFLGSYDSEGDEFQSQVFFGGSDRQPDDRKPVSKKDKQRIGFLYLRSLRTANRAASLQRGSLLDILLGLSGARPKVWERLLANLRSSSTELASDPSLSPVLDQLQLLLGDYLPGRDGATLRSNLVVGELTRRHLRTIITYFLQSTPGADYYVPHDSTGSGVTNVLVLALLSAIAKAKPNVIFAMEEPEIGLPPYTQRRIIDRLLALSSQVIVTTHSPYVAECFLDREIAVVKRTSDGVVTGRFASPEDHFKKPKHYRTKFRRTFAEGLLSRAVLLTEGVSDQSSLCAIDRRLAGLAGTSYVPLDLNGIAVLAVDSKDSIPAFASFFRDLGLQVFALSDQIDSSLRERLDELTHYHYHHEFSGIEQLLADEVPADALRQFLAQASERPDYPKHVSPDIADISDDDVRLRVAEVLRHAKGNDYAALLIDSLDAPLHALPASLVLPLAKVSHLLTKRAYPRTDPLFSIIGHVGSELFQDDAPPAEPR